MPSLTVWGQRLVKFELAWQRHQQVRAIRHALRLTFPLVFLGSLATFIDQAWLQTTGYYYQTLHVNHWLLQLTLLKRYVRLVSAGTLGFSGIMVAFAVSYYLVADKTAHPTDRLLAGVTAVIGMKFFNVDCGTVLQVQSIKWSANNLGLSGILLGILMGVLVGNSFRWVVQRRTTQEEQLTQSLWLTSIWTLGTAAVGLLWVSAQTVSFNATLIGLLRWPFRLSHFIVGLWGFSALTGVFAWLGMLGPLATTGQTVETAQNLAAVLLHHGWQLPYPLTVHTVISVYANFGGSGMVLGLLLALFLTRPPRAQRRIGWLSVLPTLGNLNAPLMTGLPVILDPLLGIPFLLAPLATITVSWICLRLNWVPAVAYPLAAGTPAPLLAYLGTGGNWRAFALALVDLAISTAIYWPFLKWLWLAEAQGGDEK